MKDYFGKDLEVGDKVVYTMYKWASFQEGYIVKITPHRVYIAHMKSNPYWYYIKSYNVSRRIIKVEENGN